MDQTETPLYLFPDGDIARMDDDIVAALEEQFEYTIGRDFIFEFNIDEDQFYDVLSIIDAHNAPALIQVGLRDKASVRNFLLRHELHHLIHNNSAFVETAKRSGVTVEDYMELYSAARWSNKPAYDDLIRGLETYKDLKDYRFCRQTLLPLIVRGVISYDVAETIGYKTLERSSSRAMVISALIAIEDKNSKVAITAEHVAEALTEGLTKETGSALDELQRVNAMVDGKLSLMTKFGGEAGLKFKHPARVHHTIRQQWSVYRAHIDIDFALFIDEMHDALTLDVPAVAEMRLMHEAGVDPVFAAKTIKVESEWSANRIIALHNGSASALTNGWL